MNRVPHTLRLLLDSFPGPAATRRLDRSLRPAGHRRAPLASFLEASGSRAPRDDRRRRRRLRRRLAQGLALGGTGWAAAWILLESARAVAIF